MILIIIDLQFMVLLVHQFLFYNNKIIEIHKFCSKEEFNIGIFLYYPLKEYFDKYKRNKFIPIID